MKTISNLNVVIPEIRMDVRPFVIGVTGLPGSGKTYFTRLMLKSLGQTLLSTYLFNADDRVGAARLQKRDELIEAFGPEIWDGNLGDFNVKVLGELVFASRENNQKICNIIHPVIREDFRKWLNPDLDIMILDAPLLFESGMDEECHYIISLYTPLWDRQQRVRERGWTESDLDVRERSMMPEDTRFPNSHCVVSNLGDERDLEDSAGIIISRLT